MITWEELAVYPRRRCLARHAMARVAVREGRGEWSVWQCERPTWEELAVYPHPRCLARPIYQANAVVKDAYMAGGAK